MSQNYKEDFTGDDVNQVLGVSGTMGLALAALKTDFAGALEPTVGVEAYSTWLDLAVPGIFKMKVRNTANTDWAIIWEWDGTTSPPAPKGSKALAFSIVFGS